MSQETRSANALTLQVTIHSADEKEPVALSVHHTPIAVTLAFFSEETFVVVRRIADSAGSRLQGRASDGWSPYNPAKRVW